MFELKIQHLRTEDLGGDDIFTYGLMARLASLLLEAIKMEIRKAVAMQGGRGTSKGRPQGVPTDPKFVNSFWVRPDGHQLLVGTSWPNIDAMLEGRKPFPLKWLTRQKGVAKVPFPGPMNTVLIRTTPKDPDHAWIHPGFKKQDFLDKALKRARKPMIDAIARQVRTKMKTHRYL